MLQVRSQKNENYYLPVITFFILCKVHPVQTVRHIVLGHPLVGVLSSLGRDSDDLCRSAKVNLQPLITSVVFRGPGPHIAAPTPAMETGAMCGVIGIPLRRGCDHVISETARLHSHWPVTECTYIRRNRINHFFWNG